MSTIPNPTQAVIERLNVIRALFLGRVADCRMRQGYASQLHAAKLEGAIESFTYAANEIAKAIRDIQRDSNHRQDSAYRPWMIDPMQVNNPKREEND